MLKAYLLILVVFLFAHCGGDESSIPGSQKPVDKNKAMVENITSNLVFTGMQNLAMTTDRLFANSKKACSAEGIETSTLQEDWKRSMQVFHYLEAVPFGAFSAKKIGACEYSGGLACRLYAFPMAIHQGRIQKQMSKSKTPDGEYKFPEDSLTAIGLDAIEYVLFEVLKSDKTVTEASEACPYLQLLAEDAVKASVELRQDFRTSQLVPLSEDPPEAHYKEAVKEIAVSLSFFRDTFLYRKVNQLLGLKGSDGNAYPIACTDDCAGYMEHPWALMAKEALQWNLESFRLIYTGDSEAAEKSTEGFGIQDYLNESGHEKASSSPLEVSQKMIDALETFKSGMDFQDAVDELAGEACAGGALCDLQVQADSLAQWVTHDLLTLLTDGSTGSVGGDAD